MKDKAVNQLLNIAKKNPKCKNLILALVTFILAFYYFFNPIMKNGRKITAFILTCVVFTLSSSFAFPSSQYLEETNSVSGEKLIMESSDGTIEIKEVDMSTFTATEEDLVELAREVSDTSVSDNLADSSTESSMVYDEVYGYTEASFEDDWKLILVNKDNPVPEDYKFELGTIRGNIKSDIRVIEHILALIQGAKEEGVKLAICSPYRDYDRQVMLFNRKVKNYMRYGMSEDEAYEMASQTVAIPGTSEHQIGLAFDLISNNYTSLNAGFADTDAGKWLSENSYKYGFILRYPLGKEDVTKIEFEPWHYRYVGVEAATEIMEQGITLEEYVEQIGLE